MLKLEKVSVHFGNEAALSEITLEFLSKKTTVLIGPSGCGKSTILRLLAGLQQLESGSIYFEESPLSPDNITALRHRMGYVIQEGGLFPHLTVKDNVGLMPVYLDWPPEKVNERLNELAELVHISTNLLERYPDELSGGQRQRVSIMRALMLNPDLLLLDEPLGALDPMIRFELQQDLKDIFDRLDKTVIMVTHDIAEAAYFADQIVLLRSGKLIQQGTLTELASSPIEPFVTNFIHAQREPLANLERMLS